MSFGELEHLILLQIIRLGDEAFAIDIREHLEGLAERRITRGALYRSLDRLSEKGLINWTTVEPTGDRGGHVRRRFSVTELGVEAVASRRETLLRLWDGIEPALRR